MGVMVRYNTKGDILYPKEFQIGAKRVGGEMQPNGIKVLSKAVDARDGSEYFPQVQVETVDIANSIVFGIVTAEEIQTVHTVLAKLYDGIDVVQEAIAQKVVVEDEIVI